MNVSSIDLKILLQPGLGLKRWLVLLAVGIILFGIGIGFTMAFSLSPKVLPVLRTLTLAEIHPLARGLIFAVIGVALIGFALFRIYRMVVSGAVLGGGKVNFLTALDTERRQKQGARIVAIGGGTGISTMLRGLKYHTGNLTAIVTTSDDGGSSGLLRSDLHIPPPGDARNCLVALSKSEPLMEELFHYRFNRNSHLSGHSLGNLLLAALYETRGGFQQSLNAAAQLLALSGRVVPVCADSNLVLKAETTSGQILSGESTVGYTPEPLYRVWIEPTDATASEAAVEAILDADAVVIGPGSLYTSIIPNFLVNGISQAVQKTTAPTIFVCNVATQRHETDGYSAAQHLKVFREHSGVSINHLLVNSNVEPLPETWNQLAITPQPKIDDFDGTVVLADVINTSMRTRHDPEKLALAIVSIAYNSLKSTNSSIKP